MNFGEIRVFVKHYRYDGEELRRYLRSKPNGFKPETKGGQTTVTIVDKDGNEYIGVSHCSRQDAFCYKTGRILATRRALEVMINGFESVI